MENLCTLRVQADVNELARIRDFVEIQATALGVAPDAVYDLVLAANEIATNIVVHGYRGQPGTIEIEVRSERDAVEIVLRDRTARFDPTSAPPPDITVPLEKRPPGGMGIHLTRRLTDAMLYRFIPNGGNEVTLIKRGVVVGDLKE
jgi:anti-sigma regulatory factor (Ser/Thr protein kinase)